MDTIEIHPGRSIWHIPILFPKNSQVIRSYSRRYHPNSCTKRSTNARKKEITKLKRNYSSFLRISDNLIPNVNS